MKIIKNGNAQYDIKIQFPVKHICSSCKTVMELEEDDIREGYLGLAYVVCPSCHKISYLDDVEGLDKQITMDNIEFPKHFYHFGGKDSVELTSGEIKDYIKRAINFFRENPDNFCYETGTGDTLIFVLNYPGNEQYSITVCKGYYQTEINYTNDDYKVDMYELWKNKGVNKKL